MPGTARCVRERRACHKPPGHLVPPVAQNTSHVQSPPTLLGGEETPASGPGRNTELGDRGGELAALGTSPARHARAAAIGL